MFIILGIVKNYNCECLMMFCIIIGIIYTVFNWYGSKGKWIYSNWIRNSSIIIKSVEGVVVVCELSSYRVMR